MTERKKQGRERKVWVRVHGFYLSCDTSNTCGDADDSDNAGNPGNACRGGLFGGCCGNRHRLILVV